jgi:Tol biopolymer transport system component
VLVAGAGVRLAGKPLVSPPELASPDQTSPLRPVATPRDPLTLRRFTQLEHELASNLRRPRGGRMLSSGFVVGAGEGGAMAGSAVARLLATYLIAAATAVVAPPATSSAAFPGSDGLIVFGRETIAGDHTQTDLYTVRPDGTGVVRLTATPNKNEFGASWNPAGNRLTFWRTAAPFGPGSVWVMAGDGSNRRQLTSGIDARDPAWSANGRRLVFNNGSDLYTMRASDGGDLQRLTRGTPHDFEPAWSPDGTRIAFSRGFEQGDVGNLYVLHLATHRVVRITSGAGYDHQVAWGPRGHRLVFERDFDRRSQIFTIRPDGTDVKRLTAGPFFDLAPAYSPTGQRIVFSSDRDSAFFHDLWVINREGGNPHRLLHLDFAANEPDWQAT